MSSPQTFGRRGLSLPNAQQSPPPGKPPLVGTDRSGGGPKWLLFSLEGRIPRMHYWLGRIGLIIFYQVIIASSQAIRRLSESGDSFHSAPLPVLLAALLALVIMLLGLCAGFWVSFAIVVKRWHDRGKSWAWALLGFVPIIGWIWQGVECGFLEGTLGQNRFGPSPKGITAVLYGDQMADIPSA